ncbi:uracil-DNA glycosylase [Pseudomonas putida]|uniref:Uracil-DNA glycosylase n=1 Tax=Pseudomonas putida TaxID=303 RepID=A0A7Y7ZEZ1_PSEPU|nr:uracil-DNA glycosylase [Pseudomonas putida]NWC83168.1 uracil-DNA glycosylase [Pseudomonas putida]
MNTDLAKALVDTLPLGTDRLYNPWTDRCVHDAAQNAPEARLKRLAQHLACRAKLILVGEAPGYQGCRYSGVAFTSEKLLMQGLIPRVDNRGARLTDRELPFSEPSATIVWKKLHDLGLAEDTLLWNAVQLHPFKPGVPWSNRTPTRTELAHGRGAIHLLKEAFPDARWVAIGRQAERQLAAAGIVGLATVRHPANGGATEFAKGLADIAKAIPPVHE